MPSVGVIKISSSCDLSIFSSQVDPHCVEGGGDAPKRSLSPSIGELWPDIDKLDEVNRGATFVGDLSGGTLRERSSSMSVVRVNESASPTNKMTLMDNAPGPSSAPPRGHGRGRGSVRKKRPHRFWPLPPELSHPTCGGRLWIDGIRLQPVWIGANEKLF
jgi:hypothetical protein